MSHPRSDQKWAVRTSTSYRMEEGPILGQGTYGSVVKALDEKGAVVAMKKIKREKPKEGVSAVSSCLFVLLDIFFCSAFFKLNCYSVAFSNSTLLPRMRHVF